MVDSIDKELTYIS